jgi:imidazole glycerol phosphate synthase subunit HisF
MAYLEAKFFGVGEILLNVALGVDDDGRRTGLVSEQIRRVRETAQIVLFQNHGSTLRFLAPHFAGCPSQKNSSAATW